jgi:DNA-binding Lrp family transcriptional regulator|tara:strand:- start:498 stop:1100 length:603 start_codon:yes stop_codon:yes gene_type:complete
MDERDNKIISILSKDPEASQHTIANHVGITQPAVAMRIKRLKKTGLLQLKFELNLQKLGFQAAKIGVVAKDTTEVLRSFEGCPAFINGFVTTGNTNVSLLFAMEDLSSVQCLVQRHLCRHPAVESTEESLIVSSSKGLSMPMDLNTTKKEVTPCGAICHSCSYYESKECLGCPATTYYRGSIWKTDGASRESKVRERRRR